MSLFVITKRVTNVKTKRVINKVNISKSNSNLSNIINSIESVDFNASGFVVESVKKSNSNSVYVEISESNNNLDYLQTFIIRFSDHHCCNHSNNLVMNLVSNNGQMLIGSSMMRRIKNNIESYKDREESRLLAMD